MDQLIIVLIALGAGAIKWWLERCAEKGKEQQPPPQDWRTLQPHRSDDAPSGGDPMDELMEALGKRPAEAPPLPMAAPVAPPPPAPVVVPVPPPAPAVFAPAPAPVMREMASYAETNAAPVPTPFQNYEFAMPVAPAAPANSSLGKAAASMAVSRPGKIAMILRDPASLRRAIVLNEILLPPVSMRSA
jgi:hypothetical protein